MAIGGIINTGTHPKLLWPGVRAIWGQRYDEHLMEHPDLYEELTSEQAYEQDVQVTGFGLANIKEEGGSITYDSEVQGLVNTYFHLAYSLGFIVTWEELKDNLYNKVASDRAYGNAFSISQSVENLAVVPYNDAFAGAFYVSADAQPLISTAHINVTGGTYSNRLSPDSDLLEGSLEDMAILCMGFQNDRGLKISIIPQSLHISINEWFNANRILKSVLQSGSGNNDINVLKATNAYPKGIKMNHYFANPHSWFTRTNCPKGMTMFWREKPDFDQDNDFDTKNAKAASWFRVSFGNTDPRGVAGSNGP